MDDQIDLFQEHKSKRDKFEKYHKDNPHVYSLFKKYAFQLINSGVRRFGSKLIIERIRYETAIETKSEDFKISNNHTCYYSRLFALQYPEYKKVFIFKEIKN